MTDKVTRLPTKTKAKLGPNYLTVVPRKFGGCEHKRTLIDIEASELECADCGTKLNPIKWLVEIGNEEHGLWERLARLRGLADELEKRTRTKCIHCQKMTPIHVDMSEEKLRSLSDAAKRKMEEEGS